MKTTNSRNRTARLAATACAVMILANMGWSQPSPAPCNSSMIDALKSLEYATENMEQYLRYEAPSFNESAAYAMYKASLDVWASKTAEMLKYKAPSTETIETAEIQKELKSWADNVKNSLYYEAPSIEAVAISEALSELTVWADKIHQDLRYEAPAVRTAETREASERLVIFAENTMNRLKYNAPALETVETEETLRYLEAFAEKSVHEMLEYEPVHPPVFAFEYTSPDAIQEASGEYLTMNPAENR